MYMCSLYIGHAFGAGAFLALAHDYRIMRSDRGWWCVPAATVGLQIPLPQGLIALLRFIHFVRLCIFFGGVLQYYKAMDVQYMYSTICMCMLLLLQN